MYTVAAAGESATNLVASGQVSPSRSSPLLTVMRLADTSVAPLTVTCPAQNMSEAPPAMVPPVVVMLVPSTCILNLPVEDSLRAIFSFCLDRSVGVVLPIVDTG